MSTSGRIHGEFLRFLYILAHRRTKRWFERLGYDVVRCFIEATFKHN